MSVWSKTAVLVPAGAGSPTRALTSALMRPKPMKSQPVAAGAANELSTYLASLATMMLGLLGSSPGVASRPLIGVLGGGGLVVPFVRLSTTGLAFEPT